MDILAINGLLLNSIAHIVGSDTSETLDFAIRTDDIEFILRMDVPKYHTNFFNPSVWITVGCPYVYDNSRTLMPQYPDALLDWPPAILFDTVYGLAVLFNFRVTAIQVLTYERRKDEFYVDFVTMHAKELEKNRQTDGLTMLQHHRRVLEQARQRQGRTETGARYAVTGNSHIVNMMYIVTPGPIKAAIHKAQEEAASVKHELLLKSIEWWRDNVSPSVEGWCSE
ncbi:hypothetical protein C8Q75DRAFT_865983 [Abortiporus biennis]|nr:hypothetical protein C8Q75DRAFT_865983 [Abortiporus biennis]